MCLFHKVTPNTSILLQGQQFADYEKRVFIPPGIPAQFPVKIPAIGGIQAPQIDIG